MGLEMGGTAPTFVITADSKDITEKIKQRLIEITLTLESEDRVDSLTLKLANQDISPPQMGTKLRVQLGYKETGLTNPLSFTIDEISHSGPPHILTVKARAAILDSNSTLKEIKHRSWHDISFFNVATKIAKEHGLKLVMQDSLRNINVSHHDQINNDLTTLYVMAHKAGVHDLAVRIVNQQLVIARKVVSETIVSKTPMKTVKIHANEVASYRILRAEREKYHRVIATYLDSEKEYRQVSAGHGDPAFILPVLYDNSESALRAAETRLKALLAGTISLNITMPGRPTLQPQNTLEITGLPWCSGPWSIISTIHRLSSSGFITEIRARQKC